ncbi:DUF2726 domain-containing protein [Caballeronia sp. GAWG1-1]|uniref:DUF2726 domain-containing protein n=1 Tax=Caballeronia sp. GAWG1-1 TaxID=2921742 RepID=UPI0020288985|nr:DUF2726 domain-containing protein [Caballeronia sp. GAWG1-1]
MTRAKKKSSSHKKLQPMTGEQRIGEQRTGEQRMAAAVTLVSVKELIAESDRLSDERDWQGLLSLSAMPLSAFPAHEQQAARVHLLHCRAGGMVHPDAARDPNRDFDPAALLATYEELRSLDPRFHETVAFYHYLAMDRYTIVGANRSLLALLSVFPVSPRVGLLREMRRAVEWLTIRSDEDWEEDRTQEDEEILAALPDLSAIFMDACDAVVANENRFDDVDVALQAKIFKLDWLARTVSPDEAEWLADQIRSLPEPAPRQGETRFQPRQGWGNCPTPRAWAFLIATAGTTAGGWAKLDARYPEDLGNLLCNGIRQLVRAMVAEPDQAERYFVRGVELLSQVHMEEREDCFGQFLLVQQESGVDDMDCGLHLPSRADLVRRLAEHAARGFPFVDELFALREALEASRAYDTIQLSSDTPALARVDWLAERSLSFTTMMADVAPSAAERLFFAVQSLRRYVEGNQSAFESVHDYSSGLDEPVDAAMTARLGAEVLALSGVEAEMGLTHLKVWLSLVGPVFDLLHRCHEGPVADSLLYRCALVCRDALADARPMLVSHLDELAGNWKSALGQNLLYIERETVAQAHEESRGLIDRAPSADILRELEQAVLDHRTVLGDKNFAAALLRQIVERLGVFDRNDQFARTAVNRWPALKPQARKILSVLCTIKNYSGFDELGSYAGMTGEWAEHHYRRLVSEGMVFETKTGWQVNRHIAPLIAQESRHALVGRIIHAGGSSSAVKQLFNSDREHTIYQALLQLCPNHLVFPNCSLQSVFSFDRMKELVTSEDFSYYLMASVDVVVVSSTTYLPLLAIEVDSVYHDTEKQLVRDDKKDRIFQAGGLPLLRLRPAGNPSPEVIRGQVAEHLDELLNQVRQDLPGHEQAVSLIRSLTLTQRPGNHFHEDKGG